MSFLILLAAFLVAPPDSPPVDRASRPSASRTGIRTARLSLTAIEREEMRGIAGRLLEAADSGRLILTNGERERQQLRQVAALDAESPPMLAISLLRALDTLASASTIEKPLKVSSLFRPLAPGRPNEPHGNGQAADILAFAGFEIRSVNPRDCEEAVLAAIQALGPGAFRLGLPMPPASLPAPLLPPPDRRFDWPFFPPPLAEVYEELDLVMPRLDQDGRIPPGRMTPVILRWANARYAPLADIQSARVRAAIDSAIARGVNIHNLFPDGTDHLHLDVKPVP